MSQTGRFSPPRRWAVLLLAVLVACDGGTRGSGIGAGFSTVTGSIAGEAGQGSGIPLSVAPGDASPAIVVQVREFPDIQTTVDPVTRNFTLADVPAGDVTLDFISATTASLSLHGLPEDVEVVIVNVRFDGARANPAGFALTPKEGDSAEIVASARKAPIGPQGLEVEFAIGEISVPGPPQVVWTFGDGTNSGRTTTAHTFTAPGTYVVEASIRGDGVSQRAFTVIQVLAADDRSLQVTAEASPDHGLPPLNVVFTATAENGVGTVSYAWDFDDYTPPGAGPTVRHTFTQEGIFLVQVFAEDDGGNESRDVVQVRVSKGTRPVPLTVRASVDRPSGAAPHRVRLSATITGSGPVSIEWDFDDGSLQSSDPNPVHIYASPGLYFPTIRVTDVGSGETAVAQVSVSVSPP